MRIILCSFRITFFSVFISILFMPSFAFAVGCMNVVIVNDFAYGACDNSIDVVELDTLERNEINVQADDIAADIDANLIFVQSGSTLTVLNIENPFNPVVVDVVNTNFSFFSGLSAANGVLVVSAGAGSANTQVFTYSLSSNDIGSLTLTTNGIPLIDNAVGNPDVHLTETDNGAIAFYSQDIGAVANFAIQAVTLSTSGQVLNIDDDVVLTPGAFNFGLGLGAANFPVESEFLDSRLYVAHFAAQGIEVIDVSDDKRLLPVIPLSYEPTNITTDGELLFVVGPTNSTVDVIDPISLTVVDNLNADQPLNQALGVAASKTHIAIADGIDGLITIARPVSGEEPELCFPVKTDSDDVVIVCL